MTGSYEADVTVIGSGSWATAIGKILSFIAKPVYRMLYDNSGTS